MSKSLNTAIDVMRAAVGVKKLNLESMELLNGVRYCQTQMLCHTIGLSLITE